MKPFEGRRILITGGTGSLGKVLIRRLLIDCRVAGTQQATIRNSILAILAISAILAMLEAHDCASAPRPP